jgi:ribosomal protein S27E
VITLNRLSKKPGAPHGYLLAECGECGRVLKVPTGSTSRTSTGFIVEVGIHCPCGAVGRKLDTGDTPQPEPQPRPNPPRPDQDLQGKAYPSVLCCQECGAELLFPGPCPSCESFRKEIVRRHGVQQAVTGAGLGPGQHMITCKMCGSTQIAAGNRGFGLANATLGTLLVGPVGALGGFLGSASVRVSCLNCGYSWRPESK